MTKRGSRIIQAVIWVILLAAAPSCVSHLREAKAFYARGQEYSRALRNEEAIAAYKKAHLEACREAEENPSAQAYMMRGLIEIHLENWSEAENSFMSAFALGFDKGEEWAQNTALYGLSLSLLELGLEDSAGKMMEVLMDRCRLLPVKLAAAAKYTEIALQDAQNSSGKTKQKKLNALLKNLEKITGQNPAHSTPHYLISQVCSHLGDYRRCFEEAVIAKELGLPTKEIEHDNDLFIVFCVRKLEAVLSTEEWNEFFSRYSTWTEKWKWPEPFVPCWKH